MNYDRVFAIPNPYYREPLNGLAGSISNFSRLVSLILGIFLITVAVAGFLDIQTGTTAPRENLEYLSPPEVIYITVTPGGSIVTSAETMTPVVNYASATVAMAFTQIAVTTQTIIPTSTPLLQTNYPPLSYYPLPYTPHFFSLGVHIVQPNEYFFASARRTGCCHKPLHTSMTFHWKQHSS